MTRSSLALLLLSLLGALLGCSKTPTFIDDGAGSIACKVASDCPGLETECASRACEEGFCRADVRPLGYLIGLQTGGDCSKMACDGNGNLVTLADDADTPNDGNACTVNACEAGAPRTDNAPSGTPCGNGLSCNGSGQCAGCATSADCGTDTSCLALTCQDTICVFGYVPAGQGDPGGQVLGDCHQTTCNGMGGTQVLVNEADVPIDGNPCTSDLCSGGLPSNPPSPAGSPCGSFTCDGQGSCTGCANDSDCGVSSACATHTCHAGACQSDYVPAGQGDPGGQAAGNCQKAVCNGQGGTTTAADDADVPNDGNACTADQCNNGVPSNPPLGAGAACGGGQCDGSGACVGCLSDGDCGQATSCKTPVCNGGSCGTDYVPLGQGNPGGQTGGDCHKVVCDGSGGTTTINDDGDVPNDGNACTSDSCSNGQPIFNPIAPQDDGNPCTTDTCDPASGQTLHPAVGDGTSCDNCSSCYSGTCYYNCGDCEYCVGGVGGYCQYACGFCEYCYFGSCNYDPYCYF